jgi:hypothetical protein
MDKDCLVGGRRKSKAQSSLDLMPVARVSNFAQTHARPLSNLRKLSVS